MSGESESRKSKKKSKHRKAAYDDDLVEKEVARAMKQMEKAMKQAKLAEKEARRAGKEGSRTRHKVEVGGDSSDEGTRAGLTVIRNTVTHPGTVIHVESAENLQVGSNNTMHIYKDRKGRKSSRQDSSSDSDDEGTSHPARDPPTEPLQNRDPNQLTAAERRMLDVLMSERDITPDDMTVCSQHVGNWRRFLRHLNLDETLIEQIHLDFHAEGVQQIIYQGVLEWTQKQGRAATVGALARVLEKLDLKEAIGYLHP